MNQKISELQKWLRSNNFKACIIPTADPHQSEYTEEYYKLRAYMSGFTGSAGTLVVTDSKAALFTDSRYHIQASIQLQGSGIELMKSGLPGVPEYPAWLKDEVKDAPVAANDISIRTAIKTAIVRFDTDLTFFIFGPPLLKFLSGSVTEQGIYCIIISPF